MSYGKAADLEAEAPRDQRGGLAAIIRYDEGAVPGMPLLVRHAHQGAGCPAFDPATRRLPQSQQQ
jgi:hypothetical protein